MSPPAGTITFVFTDIEGSTRLWEERPEAMRRALEAHDALLRRAVEASGGFLVKTTGDGCLAAFSTAPEALAAALALQQALHRQPPDTLPLRVRAALHTGDAQWRDGEYFGSTLNRAARLLALAHGGQTLLSQAAQELARDALPTGARLQNLGEHRLKDLGRPETVFQLLHPDLPDAFPPLRSLAAFPNNLPSQLTSFVGREQEVQQVRQLLEKTRLLTLTGAGGAGKTRLSLEVAAEVLESFADGVFLAELAPLSDPSLVAQTVAQALGVREVADEAIVQTLARALQAKRLLLVLDNCEHVLEAAAQLAEALLRGCPWVRILSSSREPLRVSGEMTFRVPSLSLPALGQAPTAQSLNQYESVRLFIERAQFHEPSFTVTNRSAPALASICHRLDGIPLAIEMAAARVRAMTLEELNRRLDDRFRLLTGGARTALPRQRTLHALIDWSYGLLEARERTLFVRLSVFAGGWTLEAAERVGGGEGIEAWEVLDLLSSLVDKSLVLAEPVGDSMRYSFLETVRQFAIEHLSSSGEEESVRDRHLDWFLQCAEEGDTSLTAGRWMDALERDHDNLRSALRHAEKQPQMRLRMARALHAFWSDRGFWTEGLEFLRSALEHSDPNESTALRAQALCGASMLALHIVDYADAWRLQEEARTIYHELGDRRQEASCLNGLGAIFLFLQGYEAARILSEQARAIFVEIEHPEGVLGCLRTLCEYALRFRDFDRARAYLEEIQVVCPGATWRDCEGVLLFEAGELEAARRLFEEEVEHCQAFGTLMYTIKAKRELGEVCREMGDYETARSLLQECLRINWDLRALDPVAGGLEAMAPLVWAQDRSAWAVRLWGASVALNRRLRKALFPLWEERIARGLALARADLGEEAFQSAFAEGQQMPVEDAIAYALAWEPRS